MLYLNVNERVMTQWQRTIDLYHSLYLSSIYSELKSVNLLIEEEPLNSSDTLIYRCEVTVIPKNGGTLRAVVESENCGSAIEQSFAKAKRCIMRRIRGFSESLPVASNDLGDLADRP